MKKISREDLVFAIQSVTQIPELEMNDNELVEDVVALAIVYNNQDSFTVAVAEIIRALIQLVSGRVNGMELSHNSNTWKSYHFQSVRRNGQEADLRIIYQEVDGKLRVRGFGNRHLPTDFYQRIYCR